jgi:hypothetical protein
MRLVRTAILCLALGLLPAAAEQISVTPSGGGGAPTGAAGGGLAGTYPNPTVATNANMTGDVTSVGNATSYNNAIPAAKMPALTGDCTTSAGAVATSCTKTGGVTFAVSATTDATNATNIGSGALAKARGGTAGTSGAVSAITFGGNASVAGGATVFFGQGISGASDAQYAIIPIAGVLSNFTVQTNTVPAGVQTYVLTLDNGTGATAMTCTITGAANACTDNVHTIGVVQGNFLSVKMVASATAATSTGSYFSVVFTPN